MKSFVVRKSPTEKFSAVVIATGVAAPHEQLAQVEASLRRLRVCGTVVFDLLTANGTKTRRFFSIPFDGEHFSEVRFLRVDGDDSLRASTAQFFYQHLDEVDLTLLSPALQRAVRQGSPV